MSHLFDSPGFPDPHDRGEDAPTPFPRWGRRLAEADALLRFAPPAEPGRDRDDRDT